MSSLGVVVVTTLLGAGAASLLAQFLIYWLGITNFEGGSGYFFVIITGLGAIAGFFVGLFTALALPSDFWRTQAWAASIVVVLTVIAGVTAVVAGDDGPRIDGQHTVVELELKPPRGWQPDHQAKFDGGSCWVMPKPVDDGQPVHPLFMGDMDLHSAHQQDGQWTIPASSKLNKTTRSRYLRILLGRTHLTIALPLPRKPGAAYKQWSAWTTAGFLPQKGEPAAVGFAYRYRVLGEDDYKKNYPNWREKFQDERKQTLAAMPADAPVADWLPFFEDEEQKRPDYVQVEPRALDAVKAHPADLAPLLRSADGVVVRRAVFATAALQETPAALVDPLAKAAERGIDLIREARAAALPGDPHLVAESLAYNFFSYWNQAMNHAGPSATARHRALLEALRRELKDLPAGPGELHRIDDAIHKEL